MPHTSDDHCANAQPENHSENPSTNQSKLDEQDAHNQPSGQTHRNSYGRYERLTQTQSSSSRFVLKAGMIGVLILLFMVGIGFISGLVNEREGYAASVVSDIKRSHVREQYITTPIVFVPQTLYTPCKEQQRRDGKLFDVLTTCKERVMQHAVPTSADWQHKTSVTNNKLKRGIYHAISYDTTVKLSTQFDFTDSKFKDETKVNAAGQTTGRKTHWHEAKVVLPISDLRGLKTIPKLNLDSRNYSFSYPEKEVFLGLSYVESLVPQKHQLGFGRSIPMHFNFELQGISALSVIPLGKAFTMRMHSNWADPKFTGDALPEKRSISDTGFTANWKVSYLSVANTQLLNTCMSKPYESCAELAPSAFVYGAADKHHGSSANGVSVQFIDAVDTYVFTDRVIKYALMLLLVIFGAFFIFEVLKSLRIHPVQYSLVAAALLVFYLLLLSLSEHISFAYAYLVAAAACVSLLGWYIFYVLGSLVRASVFTAVLIMLYGSFYVIIQSESDSLVIGSAFCFISIAAAMYFTRHIDWYRATEAQPQ